MHYDGNLGPFCDNAYLNLLLRCWRSVEEGCLSLLALAKFYSLVFTYGDVIARDIKVHGTRVTSIVNWECTKRFAAHVEYYG
ncbi:hypothetical protein F5146DRAFT_1053262 [Armillaria mellea]|nr:hypothetical protein F5146DRAFT_1053262 [Armillaria mellea]